MRVPNSYPSKSRVISASLPLALLGAAGCFFTEVVNEAPVPGIRTLTEGLHYKGDLLRFNATKTVDDVTSDLSCEWQARTCNDANSPRCSQIGETVRGNINTVFEVPIESHDSIEIQLRVTDELGATRLQPDLLTIDVSNQNPSIDLQPNGNREGASGAFILYRPIDLVLIPGPAAGPGGLLDADGDDIDFTWRLFPPVNSQEAAREFTPVGEEGYVLVPDVSGSWEVEVTADDGHGGEGKIRKEVFVGVDEPPCLQSLDPVADTDGFYLVESADGPRRFSVLSVADALDPFPAAVGGDDALGEATFIWSVREPGTDVFRVVEGYEGESYLVDPLVYAPGDQLEVRVEVQDRVRGPERTLACADDSRACALSTGSGCFQRLTWGVQVQ